MLALGIIGVVLSVLGLLSFVVTVSGFNENNDVAAEIVISLIGIVCLYLSIVLG